MIEELSPFGLSWGRTGSDAFCLTRGPLRTRTQLKTQESVFGPKVRHGLLST